MAAAARRAREIGAEPEVERAEPGIGRAEPEVEPEVERAEPGTGRAEPEVERAEPALERGHQTRELRRPARDAAEPDRVGRPKGLKARRGATGRSADLGTRTLIARSGDVATLAGDRVDHRVAGHSPAAVSPALRLADSGRPFSRSGGWGREWLRGWRAEPLLVGAVVGAVVVVVLGSVAAGLALSSGSQPGAHAAGLHRPARPSGATGRHSHPAKSPAPSAGPATSLPPATSGSTPSQAPGSPATTATSGTAPAGGPQISSISPGSGAAGQSIVLSGTGLFSSSGVVTAYFGGMAAPTSCPSQSSCTVTVPDLGPSPSPVAVTLVTSSGRSNPVTFSYQ